MSAVFSSIGKTTLCVFLYLCGCVCTQIYNVYKQDQTETCGRPRQTNKLAFLQIPSNQYAFNIYSILCSHRKRLTFLWQRRKEGCSLEGMTILFLFYQKICLQAHILLERQMIPRLMESIPQRAAQCFSIILGYFPVFSHLLK